MDKKANKIMVERETFISKDKEYFSYFIKGKVRGKDVKVGVIPPDKGGYTVLDIVFNDQMACELVTTPFELKADNGQVIKGNSYSVRSFDENGEVNDGYELDCNTDDENAESLYWHVVDKNDYNRRSFIDLFKREIH